MILIEYNLEWMRDLEAITFDHYNTLQYSSIKNQEDIIYPIIRSLKRFIDLDEKIFLSNYLEQDNKYRLNERETFFEMVLDDLILTALTNTGHCDNGLLSDIVNTSVEVGLLTRKLTWYPNAQETLIRLNKLGYKLGLISNTHWRWLPERKSELQPFFDVITLSYEFGRMKPHQSIFLETLSRLGVKHNKTLHVGDNPFTDIHGAKRAGLKTAYINRNNQDTEADIVIHQLSELTQYLD